MKKSILILISSIVVVSLFNTIETSFKLWNSPTINTNHIIAPDIPVSFDTDISLFGLFINFFSDLESEYVINNTIINESLITNNISNITNTISESEELEYNAESHKQEDYDDIEDVSSDDLFTGEGELIKEVVIEEEVAPEVPLVPEVPVTEEEVIEEEVAPEVPLVPEVPVTEEEVTPEVPLVPEVRVTEEEVTPEVPLVPEVPLAPEVPVAEEEVNIKSDEEIIRDNSQIKDNAKELILESLKYEIITMDDVVGLLSENVGNEVKKKHVKELIKSKKR